VKVAPDVCKKGIQVSAKYLSQDKTSSKPFTTENVTNARKKQGFHLESDKFSASLATQCFVTCAERHGQLKESIHAQTSKKYLCWKRKSSSQR
jgi:hypothetical protein